MEIQPFVLYLEDSLGWLFALVCCFVTFAVKTRWGYNKVQRDVYLYEFSGLSFIQRFYYVWANDINIGVPSFNKSLVNISLRDFGMFIGFILTVVTFLPFVVVPYSIYRAIKYKTWYLDREQDGTYKANVYLIE